MSPRMWNRREFDVKPAGYFTVLRPSGWFSALRLQGGTRYRSRGAALPSWLEKPAGLSSAPQTRQASQTAPQMALLTSCDRSWVQFVIIAAIAAAITYGLLWYISGGK